MIRPAGVLTVPFDETLDRFARFRQHAPIGAEAGRLDREHEILRGVGRPAPEAFGFLRAVESAVNFDRRDLAARMGQFARLRQALGIEHPAAPLLERPAPDAHPDHVRASP